MAKELYFDDYDFDSNERGFSAEELETVRRLLSEGKRVWMAPVVIEDDGQLEALYVSRSRCRTWHSGPEKRLVYLTPADEETFQFLKLGLPKMQGSGLHALPHCGTARGCCPVIWHQAILSR